VLKPYEQKGIGLTMTIEEQRKAIIEDASRKEFEEWANKEFTTQDLTGAWIDGYYIYSDLQDCWRGWQAARNQSNNVPVAWTNVTHSGVITETHRQYLAEHYPNSPNDKVVPLYTSPQQSNALEMAAKVCEGLIAKSLDWDVRVQNDPFKIAADEIRKLIPPPESDGK
jgi:hypothetical protein